jgi:dihydrofolate reductase
MNFTAHRGRTDVDKETAVEIRTRMCISLDGFVTTPDGRPVQLADPTFVPGKSHGFPQFQESCEAVLMGRTTFEPALGADKWPWPNLDVFVLASHRRSGTPDHVVTESDPDRLLERLRAANNGGDVHLVGGPRTIETFRSLGALDKLGLLVLPLLVGDGMRLAPPLSTDTDLTLESERALPEGAVEIIYRAA